MDQQNLQTRNQCIRGILYNIEGVINDNEEPMSR
jgi:hypothetical protein